MAARQALIPAAVLMSIGGLLTPVAAAVPVPQAKKPKATLTVVLTGDSGGAVQRAVVTGPKGYTTTVQKTTTLKRLRPGSYAVTAPTPAVAQGSVKVRTSKNSVRVRPGRSKKVTVTYSFLGAADPGPTVKPIPPDTTAPAPVSAVTATPAGNSVGLTWVPPTDPDLAQIVVRRVQGATAPTSPADGIGVTLATALAGAVTDSGLVEKTQYSYAVFARDAAGNTSVPAAITTSTLDVTAPGTVGLTLAPKVVVGTPGVQVQLKVPNDDDLDRVLWWRVPGSAPPDTNSAPTGTFDSLIPGTFIIAQQGGLTENTGYSYAVVAQDTAGNRSAVTTETVATPGIPPGPVTDVTQSVSSTLATLTWTNPTDPDFSTSIVRFAKGTTIGPPAPPATATAGLPAYLSTPTRATFQTDPLYYYAVSFFTQDTNGNVSAPVTVTFQAPNGTGGGPR